MEIVSIHLTGFKPADLFDHLNFLDRRNPLLSETRTETKQTLLDILSGIIFGFTAEEKTQHRGDQESVKTFTGLVTMELENKTMIIERDFETDFVACLLSDPQHTRPVFQGKDIVDGNYSRPYLHMLRSVFPFTSKKLLDEIGVELAADESLRMSEIFDMLYLLFTPNFKFTSCQELVHETEILLNTRSDRDLLSEGHPQLQFVLERQRRGLEHVIKLQQASDRLNGDVQKLNALINRIRSNRKPDANENQTEGKFDNLQCINPLQFRADILLWKSLRVVKEQNESSLRQLQFKKQRIQKFLERDLAQYSKLPDTFMRDISSYKKLTALFDSKKDSLTKFNSEIQRLTSRIKIWKRFGILAMIILFPVIFISSYLLFNPAWILIIPESLLLMLAITAIFSHIRLKLKSQIYRVQEETHIVEKKLHEISNDLTELRKNAIFITDMAYLDNHVERYKKYRQLQAELKRITKEELRITNLLNSNAYVRQLPEYTDKYSELIDINRPDLENFLDEFVASRDANELHQPEAQILPVPDELSELTRQCNRYLAELKDVQFKVMKDLQIEGGYASYLEALDLVDRKIKNIELQQRMDFTFMSKN